MLRLADSHDKESHEFWRFISYTVTRFVYSFKESVTIITIMVSFIQVDPETKDAYLIGNLVHTSNKQGRF